jgi:hypothetical protein
MMELSLNTTGSAPEVRVALQNEFKRTSSQNPREGVALAALRDYVGGQIVGDGSDGVQYTVVAKITLSVEPVDSAAKTAESQAIKSTLDAVAATQHASAGIPGIPVPTATASAPIPVPKV